MWEYTGRKRTPFAETPGIGQESVWDYSRPPKIVADQRRVVVCFGDAIIADSISTYRVLERREPSSCADRETPRKKASLKAIHFTELINAEVIDTIPVNT